MVKEIQDRKVEVSKTIKLKKFNLEEEKIEHGWSLAKGKAFIIRQFAFLEGMWVFFTTCAVCTLGYFKGFFNIDAMPLINGAVPWYIVALALGIISESLFHFIFLGGRITKLNFWKETIPYKTISYILGALAVVFTPVATIISGAFIPFWLNHVYGNFVAKRNFDRRANYYDPQEEVVYEEPKRKEERPQAPTQPPQRATFKPVPQQAKTMFGEPKVEAISESEFANAWGDINTNVDNIELDVPNLGKFLDRWF